MNKHHNNTRITSNNNNNNTDGRPSPIFSAVALAMGVAVVVLAILEKIDNRTALIMLGTAAFALGLNQLAAITDTTRK